MCMGISLEALAPKIVVLPGIQLVCTEKVFIGNSILKLTPFNSGACMEVCIHCGQAQEFMMQGSRGSRSLALQQVHELHKIQSQGLVGSWGCVGGKERVWGCRLGNESIPELLPRLLFAT